jgi:hypothetical protein
MQSDEKAENVQNDLQQTQQPTAAPAVWRSTI